MSPAVQFVSSVILGAVVVAYLIADLWDTRFLPTLLGVGSVFGVLGFGLWRRTRKPKPSLRGMHEAIDRICDLSIDEARRGAIERLEDRDRFRCTSASSTELHPELPEAARELFSRCSKVESVAGEALLSLHETGPSDYRDELLRIGRNSDFVEVVVRPGKETVYEIDGSDADEQELEEGGVPSVFHWILVTDEVLYGRGGHGLERE